MKRTKTRSDIRQLAEEIHSILYSTQWIDLDDIEWKTKAPRGKLKKALRHLMGRGMIIAFKRKNDGEKMSYRKPKQLGIAVHV